MIPTLGLKEYGRPRPSHPEEYWTRNPRWTMRFAALRILSAVEAIFLPSPRLSGANRAGERPKKSRVERTMQLAPRVELTGAFRALLLRLTVADRGLDRRSQVDQSSALPPNQLEATRDFLLGFSSSVVSAAFFGASFAGFLFFFFFRR